MEERKRKRNIELCYSQLNKWSEQRKRRGKGCALSFVHGKEGMHTLTRQTHRYITRTYRCSSKKDVRPEFYVCFREAVRIERLALK